MEASPGLSGSLSDRDPSACQDEKPNKHKNPMTAVTAQQSPRLLRCTGGGHFGSGLLLPSISPWGTAEFVSQERCVLSSTAARLGVGLGL